MGSIPTLDADVERLVQIPGLDAAARRDPARLRLPSALPARVRAMRDDAARARSRESRSQVACWLYPRRCRPAREAAP